MTVTDIIAEALERLGVLAAGEAVDGLDQQSCLSTFKAMMMALPGMGLGGDLTDVVVTASPYNANVNERIRWDGVGSLTVNLPTLVNSNPPRNGDRVAVVNGAGRGVSVYIAGKGAWLSLASLTTATDAPLGEENDYYLIDMLAYRVAPKFGMPITAQMQAANDRAERAIAALFAPDMTQETDLALWSYWNNWNGAFA